MASLQAGNIMTGGNIMAHRIQQKITSLDIIRKKPCCGIPLHITRRIIYLLSPQVITGKPMDRQSEKHITGEMHQAPGSPERGLQELATTTLTISCQR